VTSVADLDPHHFGDPDPHQSEKLDPHRSQKADPYPNLYPKVKFWNCRGSNAAREDRGRSQWRRRGSERAVEVLYASGRRFLTL
jgi:hypothetical protein